MRRILMALKSGLLGMGIAGERELNAATEMRMYEIEMGHEAMVYAVYVAKA
jgi:hypothetical protein